MKGKSKPDVRHKISAGLKDAGKLAIQRGIETKTGLAVWEKGKIKRISASALSRSRNTKSKVKK